MVTTRDDVSDVRVVKAAFAEMGLRKTMKLSEKEAASVWLVFERVACSNGKMRDAVRNRASNCSITEATKNRLIQENNKYLTGY
jgi:heme oxygenase